MAAFPWFIDQTVGGAAATATHGSSLRHGSLSSQVVAVSVVLANGTVAEFRESVTPKHVFDAARASLGRLGATVRVTLKMKKNHPVRKTSRRTSPEAFASSVAKAVSYTHLRAHETRHDLVCRLLLEKKKKTKT